MKLLIRNSLIIGATSVPIQKMNLSVEPWRRPSAAACLEVNNENIHEMQSVDISSISTTESVASRKQVDKIVNGDELDLVTGRIGEEMVFHYLLNEYRSYPNPFSITWENQHTESNKPYDILLNKDGKNHYIEVKSTRSSDQNLFPLSINQIEAFLTYKESYFIYRVYIEQNKFVILDHIRWRLIQKDQLACF